MADSRTALIIDDEPQIRRVLRMVLEQEEYQIIESETGAGGLASVFSSRPDVVVLDLGLPDMDGVAVLKQLRARSAVPVLVLSVRDEAEDKVAALDHGADDYITKPFEPREFLARLRALQRRSQAEDGGTVLDFGELVLDFPARIVRIHEKQIKLTPTEFALLKVLAQNAGKIVTHAHLLREVWGPAAEDRSQYLRVYMTHLRKKLAQGGLESVKVANEPGIGYRFTVRE